MVYFYLESDLELFGRLDKELQAVLHHAGNWRARLMPCGTIIKSFSTLALTLSRAGAELQLTGLSSPTQIDDRAEAGNLWEVAKGTYVYACRAREREKHCRTFITALHSRVHWELIMRHPELRLGEEEEEEEMWLIVEWKEKTLPHNTQTTTLWKKEKPCRNRQK